MVVYPAGRPTLLADLVRESGPNWVPVQQSDLAGDVTYKVYDGTTQVGADGSWPAAGVVSDAYRTGDLWPGGKWNVQAKLAAGYLPFGGKTYRLVAAFTLTGGEVLLHEETITTRNVPGYEEPEV